jgi:Flp pilus assembly protein TadD
LLKTLEQVARESRFIQKDFRAQKLLLGYCPTTNVLAGERYEEMGEWNAAEREYREIVARDSKNPWGWLQLGELYGKRGDLDRGRNAFEQVLQLVPAHSPAVTALGELCLLAGDKRKAARWFKQALALNPYDETAREGLVESEK